MATPASAVPSAAASGRTPILGSVDPRVPALAAPAHYIEAILRVYNRYGCRDNAFKARIKILVKALGAEEFAPSGEEEWAHLKNGPATLTQAEVDRVARHFTTPPHETLVDRRLRLHQPPPAGEGFARWLGRNVHAHKVPGHAGHGVAESLRSRHRQRHRRADGTHRRSR